MCIGLHHMDYVFRARMHTLVKNRKHVETYIINWHLNFVDRCLAFLTFPTSSLSLSVLAPTHKVFSPCLSIIDEGVRKKWSIKQEEKRQDDTTYIFLAIMGFVDFLFLT